MPVGNHWSVGINDKPWDNTGLGNKIDCMREALGLRISTMKTGNQFC